MIQRSPLFNSNQSKVSFVLPADYPHLPISVVGEFNGWNPAANPLHPQGDGTYSTTVTLENGRRYAFRYLSSSGEWFNEGMADDFEPNGYGRDNSILIV
ncbi:MAG: isoamylase early set domain-containing protein [Caldilineaceae bacterium]|nr:isoamylase early set domain-containing protein [Caldilineaceae bacterium]